jgi:uroporphyrinogen decarboxylase
MHQMAVASVGPTTSEMLRECGFAVDIEPSHPKMGHLVKQVALDCRRVLEEKCLKGRETP